jgi:hypothetical protein
MRRDAHQDDPQTSVQAETEARDALVSGPQAVPSTPVQNPCPNLGSFRQHANRPAL